MSTIYDVKTVGGKFADQHGDVPIDVIDAQNLRLTSYPNTRNDGQLTTNKVLTTDAQGNIKLCTIAVAPAPYLDELIPDSYLPNNTGNFILKGSFFTPTMTVIVEGQTVNYTNFISDNEFHVNITTGSAEGNFDVTLNNGISKVFPNVLMIVLGDVFKPTQSEWSVSGNVDTSVDGEVISTVYMSAGVATWDKVLDYTKNFRIEWTFRRSQLGRLQEYGNVNNSFSLIKSSTSVFSLMFKPYYDPRKRTGYAVNDTVLNDNYFYYNTDEWTEEYAISLIEAINVSIRWIDNVMYVYFNNVLYKTLTNVVLTENHLLRVSVLSSDYTNIRYVELSN